jgi:hypothetical protein
MRTTGRKELLALEFFKKCFWFHQWYVRDLVEAHHQMEMCDFMYDKLNRERETNPWKMIWWPDGNGKLQRHETVTDFFEMIGWTKEVRKRISVKVAAFNKKHFSTSKINIEEPRIDGAKRGVKLMASYPHEIVSESFTSAA